ncbi:methylenetetrahydrofolate reductase [Chitinophaga silvisoli]|uniref:Methylenetetrahydrofolate reductase n=1 Tax=Chitinophaga silvisoli TaxID=2291814 RepID=A0A3E1P9E7_9BACT|nr:methylenetetrahydrofolate reductase [Chitinophaga silvisoli]RFM36815.1 5,10-methylenetetrahydrofolate reductase [Chitinophaga silvisoli]
MKGTLQHKITAGKSGIVFYSLTPPKITTESEKVAVIANNQIERLQHLDIDGLILYDIQDEALRTEKERPFSFIPTISPEVYSKDLLTNLRVPKIIYKSIANHTKEMFADWLSQNTDLEATVFIGASSQQQVQATNFSLSDAYQVKKEMGPDILLGGVTIPERHTRKGDEHLRMFSKMQNGCNFFVSQCIYNINETKNVMSDYHYHALSNDTQPVPVIFTLTPCGSLKTLQFMEWLGIEVPKWVYNDLKYSKDILQSSIHTATNIAGEILNYATAKNLPVGFNIESVSNKKDEILAAHEILENVLHMVKPLKNAVVEEKKAVSAY